MSPGGDYEAVVGLEIHVELSTRTKMFCGCSPSFGDEPNIHTCPVCLGHPGSLPTINDQAVRYALLIAAALECEVPPLRLACLIEKRMRLDFPTAPKATGRL